MFIADLVKAFETYNVDVMGITETGSKEYYGVEFKNKVIAKLEKKGLCCMWALPDPYKRNLGVMLVHRKGIRAKELEVDGSSTGRVLAVELTTWDRALSKEVKSVVVVLYGITGMTTVSTPCEDIRRFNMMVGELVAALNVTYFGRIICMGDYNSLSDSEKDGMGLVGGVVSEDSLVSVVMDQGLVDWFRLLHPSMKAVSFKGTQGSFSRIDYMLGGHGLSGVRMSYILGAEGPLSDHALLLGDIGELRSALIDVGGTSTSISEMTGWERVVSTEAPWRRFHKKSEPMRVEGTGGVLSEDGRKMQEAFRDIVEVEVKESGFDPGVMLDKLNAAFGAAEAGMEEVCGNYEMWAESGGVGELQAVVDKLAPQFLRVVQGSMRRFVGRADHSERERREHTDMVLMTMGMVGGGLKRMNYLRREMERIGASGLGASGVVDENMAKRVREVVGGVSEHFAALEGALVDVEAVPTSVKELLWRGKAEIDEMVSGDESEIPDHARQEGAAESLWLSLIHI